MQLLARINIVEKYKEILSDPFFWMLVIIFSIVGFVVYRYYIVNDARYSEEDEYLAAHLEHHGFTYLNSEHQNSAGPFAMTDNGTVKTLLPDRAFAYRKVKALNKVTQQAYEFWAKLEYASSKLKKVTWLPDPQKMGEGVFSKN